MQVQWGAWYYRSVRHTHYKVILSSIVLHSATGHTAATFSPMYSPHFMEPPYSLDALSMASESLYYELDSDAKDSKVYPTGKRPNRIVPLGSKSTSLKGMIILMSSYSVIPMMLQV